MKARSQIIIVAQLIIAFCAGQNTGSYEKSKQDSDDYNIIVSPTVYNIEDSSTIKIIEFVRLYFKYSDITNVVKSTIAKSYWSEITAKNYVIPDYMLRSALAFFDTKEIRQNIISIARENDIWICKVAFHLYKGGEFLGLICIYNYGIKIENNKLKLFNVFEIAELSCIVKDQCRFYYDNQSNSDTLFLSKMLRFNDTLAKFFGIKKKFTYVNVKDHKLINRLIGFDFEMYMFIPNKNGAFVDLASGIIYSSSNSFFNAHELTHLYINEFFSETCHSWFDEGLATYFGGSMGLRLEEHLKKIKLEVSKNGKVDFSDLLGLVRIDDETSYKYAIGGLFCKIVYDKYGKAGIINLLSSGKSEKDFYEAIEKYMGVTKEGLNKFIRRELEKY
jgi:hypothetical protein